MKRNIFSAAALLGLALTFGGCAKDVLEEPTSQVNLVFDVPEISGTYTLKSLNVTFQEINSGITQMIPVIDLTNPSLQPTLALGTYNIRLEGDILITENGNTKTYKLQGLKENVVISSASAGARVSLFLSDPAANFIFKEIFFTGTNTPEGKLYNGDKYFIIYNNSLDTLYADGLLIAQSAFLTTAKREYTPDILKEAFTSQQIVKIPGTGKQYPVAPGDQIVIANNAINHKEYNINSTDLSTADFEIELLSAINVDNPAVQNTISVSGLLTMHNRGFQSYVLARLPENVSLDNWTSSNRYTYSYVGTTGRITSADGYKISNDYIIDAVNLSVEESYEWLVTAPQLDMGWSYAGRTNSDATRYGKSVLRKILSTTADGKVIYQDTNNSTKDFIPEAKPTLF